MSKISVSLPSDTVDQLTHIAKNLGFSRSSLISSFLVEPVSLIYDVIGTIPTDSTDAEIKRYRGDSKQALAEVMHGLESQVHDLQKAIGKL